MGWAWACPIPSPSIITPRTTPKRRGGLRGEGRRDEGEASRYLHPGREVRTESQARLLIRFVWRLFTAFEFGECFSLKHLMCQYRTTKIFLANGCGQWCYGKASEEVENGGAQMKPALACKAP
jgi:hypothetical protein